MARVILSFSFFFFFQAEDGIRDLVRSRGLGDVYKRQIPNEHNMGKGATIRRGMLEAKGDLRLFTDADLSTCLLYTSDAADDLLCVDLGGRRLLKKKTKQQKKNNTDDDREHIHRHLSSQSHNTTTHHTPAP